MVKFEKAIVGPSALLPLTNVVCNAQVLLKSVEPVSSLPDVQNSFPANPFPANQIHVWIICDAVDDQLAFQTLIKSQGIVCDCFIQSNTIAQNITQILTDHITNPPQLVWIAMPKRVADVVDQRQRTAIRLLLHQQLQSGNHITVEGASNEAASKGLYIPDDWGSDFKLVQSKVWWCQFGLSASSSKKECVAEHAISSFPLPARYMSCCGKGNSRHRGVTPKRTPAGQYIAVVKMLREAFSSDQNSASSAEECESFPSNSIEKKKKLKAQGAKTLTENDGPGEHENVEHLTVRPTKFVEYHFDDCGDDLSAITSATEKLFSSFEVF